FPPITQGEAETVAGPLIHMHRLVPKKSARRNRAGEEDAADSRAAPRIACPHPTADVHAVLVVERDGTAPQPAPAQRCQGQETYGRYSTRRPAHTIGHSRLLFPTFATRRPGSAEPSGREPTGTRSQPT